MPAEDGFWQRFWDGKASQVTDFQATGRGSMDVPGFLYTIREIARHLRLRPQDELLDIGCGTGIVALALSPFVARIHAIDISATMVARAENNLSDASNVSTAVGTITITNEPAASYDKVLAYSVLQYLADMAAVERAFVEIAWVLKPGGLALLAANPDPARRDKLVAAIEAKGDADMRRTELDILDRTGWFAGDSLVAVAERNGLTASVLPIHPRIWQHFYMFDVLLRRP